MGKQVNFYMLEEDEREFVEFVLSDRKTVILGSGSLQEVPPILDRLPVEDSPPIWRNDVYFWRQGYPLFTRHVVMKVGPLQGQGVYYVDSSQSSVIEFSRSLLLPDENMLTRGRIWAEMRRLEGDKFVHKGEEFEEWYDSIAKWLRKRYRKIGTKPYFRIGSRAYNWYQAGGKLQP
jgi:hypothetical protein